MQLKRINILLIILVIILRSNQIVNDEEQQVGVLIVGGAQCEPKSYEKLKVELVNYMSKKKIKIFAKILEFSLNTPNPLEISQKVLDGIENLKEQGMQQDNIFIAAHSLGGVMSQDYLQDFQDKIKGLILMGSVILRNFREVDDEGKSQIKINFKTLTILGTKDGLMRVSRGAEQFYHQVYNIKKSKNIHDIIIFEGLSHSNFMDNKLLPSFVKNNDLKSQIDQQTGYSQIFQAIEGFIEKVLKQNESKEYLHLQNETVRIILPMMQSMILEGNYQLKKPCYNNKLINPVEKNCLKGSPWISKIAQNKMSGQISPNITIENDDNFHRVYTINPVHLPEIENSCDKNSICTLKTVTVSENVYEFLNEQLDIGITAIAASEIRVKMSSRQNVQKHLNNEDDDFHKLDEEGDRCAEINQKAIDYALKYASQEALNNYNKYGLKMNVGSDLGPFNAGPLWIWKYMQYTQQDDKIFIQSPMMRTPLNYYVSSAAGFHYCKILSPFKAMEFLYIDSIKGREPK